MAMGTKTKGDSCGLRLKALGLLQAHEDSADLVYFHLFWDDSNLHLSVCKQVHSTCETRKSKEFAKRCHTSLKRV